MAVLITVAGMSFSWIVMHVAKTILEKPDIELVAKAPAANPVQAVPANPAYRIWENTRVGTSQPDPELKVVTDNLRHAPIVTPAPGSDPNSPSGPTAFGLE
ncbi:hypothetical protein [Beijerinckia indica]|uniref:hypothetical protein n=1 Tax=Beijerinckia indica TaxID=533 RepID=UPI0011D12863|nr:hypothetical protein [Beijerinckia indica]